MVENITSYKNVKLTKSKLLLYSRLYHIEPIGIGNPRVESLSGYVARLATAHCTSALALFIEEIMPVINQIKLSQREKGYQSYKHNLTTDFYGATRPLNSMGIIASDWTQALESLTLQLNLQCLTALTWRNVISTRSWLRHTRAWCDVCYQEQFDAGKVVYEQLLWTINVVSVCSEHHCSLSTICPYCHKSQPFLNAKSRPGYCNLCEGWLGSKSIEFNESMKSNYDINEQLQIAHMMEELLASSSKFIEAPPRSGVTKAINMLIDHFTGGNLSEFARSLGVKKRMLRKLARGESLIQIELLLKICFQFNISLLNLLFANVNFIERKDGGIGNEFLFSTQSSRFRDYVYEEQILIEALNESPPASLATIAQRLLYKNPTRMYRIHSTLCHQITARYRSFKQQQPPQKVIRKHVDLENARRICELALAEDPPPYIGEVAARMGYSRKYPGSVRRLCPDLYKLLITRRVEYDKYIIDTMLMELQKALLEEPPPSISALAMRCGVSSKTFRNRFPKLCKDLENCSTKFKNQQLKKKNSILEAALYEIPVPSLNEMAKRLGYKNKSRITSLFPDISRKILMRRKEMRQQQSDETVLLLERVLNETPPPSKLEVSRRLKIGVTSLYAKYPELCRRISSRYIAYIKEMAANRKEELRAEMRRIVIELRSQGINPTYRCIISFLHQPSNARRAIFNETIQELKSELNLP